MRKNLKYRIVTSLLLSAVLLAIPVGAFWGNDGTSIQAQAVDNDAGTETGTETEKEEPVETDVAREDETESPEGETDVQEPEPECTCDSRCSQYDYNRECGVCHTDYSGCTYKEPSVRITVNTPSVWYAAGNGAKVTFTVADVLNTGNFSIKSVKAKVGQNGTYQDVTEDMCLEVSENCTVYVLVTDANDRSYEKSRSVTCFDTSKPTLNAAVSNGLLTVQASDSGSGIKAVYINGYEFTDTTNGTINIRLSQFDAGYEYFTISAMDGAGNMSETYKTKNPYYSDPDSDSDDNPAQQLPASAEATKPSEATATVTEHTVTDENGTATSATGVSEATETATGTTAEAQKKAEFAKADAEEATADTDTGNGEAQDKGKEFYTIESASGKVFYLIIDRDGEDETVYFLTEITENDLLNVTSDNSETLPKNSAALESQITVTESALPNNNTKLEEVTVPEETQEEATTVEETVEDTETGDNAADAKGSPIAGYLIIAVFGAGAVGAAYYFKVLRKKQDGDFVEDEDDDDDSEYDSDEAVSEADDFFDNNEDKEQ